MYTQRAHAICLYRRGAYFVLPVGGNQAGLCDQLDALAWQDVPIGWTTYDRGHGRQEIRTIQVMPARIPDRWPMHPTRPKCRALWTCSGSGGGLIPGEDGARPTSHKHADELHKCVIRMVCEVRSPGWRFSWTPTGWRRA
jgi:hypothetical protein